MFEATENKSRWLFLKNNLVLKNNVESVRSNLNELLIINFVTVSFYTNFKLVKHEALCDLIKQL